MDIIQKSCNRKQWTPTCCVVKELYYNLCVCFDKFIVIYQNYVIPHDKDIKTTTWPIFIDYTDYRNTHEILPKPDGLLSFNLFYYYMQITLVYNMECGSILMGIWPDDLSPGRSQHCPCYRNRKYIWVQRHRGEGNYTTTNYSVIEAQEVEKFTSTVLLEITGTTTTSAVAEPSYLCHKHVHIHTVTSLTLLLCYYPNENFL